MAKFKITIESDDSFDIMNVTLIADMLMLSDNTGVSDALPLAIHVLCNNLASYARKQALVYFEVESLSKIVKELRMTADEIDKRIEERNA